MDKFTILCVSVFQLLAKEYGTDHFDFSLHCNALKICFSKYVVELNFLSTQDFVMLTVYRDRCCNSEPNHVLTEIEDLVKAFNNRK